MTESIKYIYNTVINQMGNENSSLIETANDSLTTASGYVCGSLSDTYNESSPSRNNRSSSKQQRHNNNSRPSSPLVPSELMCASKAFRRSFSTGSLVSSSTFTDYNNDNSVSNSNRNNAQSGNNSNPMSALFARALISEVSHDHNPNAMTPSEMAAREKQLLQAQERARRNVSVSQFMKHINLWGGSNNNANAGNVEEVRGNSNNNNGKGGMLSRSYPPNQLHENRARLDSGSNNNTSHIDNTIGSRVGKHTVTIGLSLSRRHTIGHPDTVTRQTAFDFNELQDRAYKYVSSTDASGWRAGGGERGGVSTTHDGKNSPMMEETQAHKIASPDTVHIPIIQIDAESPAAVDSIIASLARGEIFIPHMSVLPEALSVNGVSPPDLIVRFGCERNDDLPPDEWPNWSLEFMHNQLYEYFAPLGARWMKRPFQITLAHKVRWRTVKHMNKYFAHAERVISAWREKGPQYLNPQLSYIEGGATPEEVARPHGIYLLRDGRPTNYFCPNLEPPYTTKMTRSLLLNVLNKSWDNKRRDWSSEPQQSLIAPSLLLGAMCGCDNTAVAGFMPDQTITPTNRDILEKQPALGAIEATTTPSKKGQSSRSKDSTDQQQQQSTPPRTKKRSSSRKHNGIASSSQMDSSNRTSPQNNPIPQSKAESPPINNRYSPSSTETSPVISEAGVSDIPERGSDVGESNVILQEEMILSKNSNNKNSNPPKPEESCPSPSIEEQQHKINKLKRETKNSISSNKSDITSCSDNDVDVVTDLPLGPFIADVQSVGESQTTDPTSNVASFRLAKEREQRKQREIEMLRERKKMEEIEAAIRRKREKEVKVDEQSPQMQQQQAQQKLKEEQQKQQLAKQQQKEAHHLALQQQQKQQEQAHLKQQQQAQHLAQQQAQKLKQQELKLAQQQQQQRLQQQKEQSQQQTIKKQEKTQLKLKKDQPDRQQRLSPQNNNITVTTTQEQKQKISSPLNRAILSPPPIKTSPKQHQLLPEQQQFENFFPTNFFNDTTTTSTTTTLHQSPNNKQSNNSQILQQHQQQQVFTQKQQYSWSPKRNNRLIRSNSADTLEYSLDSFSMSQYTNNQNSNNNNIPFDSQSVTTLNTAAGQSLLSYVTRSTIGGVGDGSTSYYNNTHHNTKDDYYEPIPTDEELFTIGWAKALDTKSGSYYYFTLDRSRIVWDNPLKNRH